MGFKYIRVALLSFGTALIFLLLERLVGIDWDFHPDSVTYATTSLMVADNIRQSGMVGLPNNAYYLIAAFFDESIFLITTYNLVLFSLTNILIAKAHWQFRPTSQGKITFFLLILLFNPYRIHLATTMLKDTSIIFLLVLVASSIRFSFFAWLPLFLLRVMSLVYGLALLKIRHIKFLIFPAFLVILFFSGQIQEQLISSNETEMQFRDFDIVPSFAELGLLGLILRSFLWPMFVLSGSFILVSPSIAYFPVSLGCITTQIYCFRFFKMPGYTLGIFIPMVLLAAVVTGFTSYIRYVYPLTIIIPLIMMRDSFEKHKNL